MAKMRPMVSMELDDEDQLDAMPISPGGAKPRFPYGLNICLTDEELKKMDLDAGEAFVGGIIHFHALARITSVSQNATTAGPRERIELQIESMCVESEDEENEEIGR